MHADTAPFSCSPSLRVQSTSSPIGASDSFDQLVSALGPSRTFVRGHHLYRAGEPCGGIYMIEQGSVKVSALSRSGEEQVVRFCLAGEMLGMEAISESRHSSSAIVLEETRVRELPLPVLQSLCQQSPDLTVELIRLVDRRISELRAHRLMLGCYSASQRLAGFLVDLSERAHAHELQLTMSREAIGSYLGVALETVSRLLHEFEHDNLIRVQGRRLCLIKPDLLRSLVRNTNAN